MLSEEAIVVCGLLMGLNALDYNVMMSGEDFDKSVSLHLGHNSIPLNSIHVQYTCILNGACDVVSNDSNTFR